MENNIGPNDKTFSCVDVRTVCFYLHKRRLALGLSPSSSAGLPPSPRLYFAANGECPAGSSEGLIAWRPLLQADSTRKTGGSFKIERPSAVWEWKRHLYEASWKSHEEILGVSPSDWDPLLSQLNTNSKRTPRIPHSLF